MVKRFTAEFIGTFFLVLAVCLSANPLAIGAIVMAMVYYAGHISGGHFNPAVTLAVWLRGKVPVTLAAVYIGAQISGAAIAALVYFYLTLSPESAGHLFVYKCGADYADALWKTGLIEGLFAFVLCSAVLTLSTSSKLRGNFTYGAAIGLTLMGCLFAAGPVSGGILNPALALGTTIFNSAILRMIPEQTDLILLAVYTIAPLLGGAVAAFVFAFLNPDETY